MKKNILIILSLLFIMALLCVLLVTIYAEEGGSTMFCNDEAWFDEYRLGYEKIFSQYYIPASMLKKFNGVDIKENTRLSTLLISRENRYISFDIDASYAYTESEGNFFLQTYLLKGGERYIPAKIVCDSIGLEFETSPDGSVIRIKDESALLTLAQLIEQYSTNKPETSSGNGNDNPSTPQGTRDVYLIFDMAPYDNTSKILKLLEQYEVSATFFIENEKALENPKAVTSILAYGHKICVGVSMDSDEDAEQIIEKLNSTNNRIFSLAKIKSRIFRMAGAGETNLTPFTQLGWVYCPADIDAMDNNRNYSANQSVTRILSLLLDEENPAISFSGGQNTYGILEKLLEYFAANSQTYNPRAVDLSALR